MDSTNQYCGEDLFLKRQWCTQRQQSSPANHTQLPKQLWSEASFMCMAPSTTFLSDCTRNLLPSSEGFGGHASTHGEEPELLWYKTKSLTSGVNVTGPQTQWEYKDFCDAPNHKNMWYVRGGGRRMDQSVLYNHTPSLPPRVWPPELSCSENTAFKRPGSFSVERSLQLHLFFKLPGSRERRCVKGRWAISPGMTFAWDVCQLSSKATGHYQMTVSHEDLAGWLHKGHLTLPLCASKLSYFKIEILGEHVP